MLDIHATTAPAFTLAIEGNDFRFSDLNAACLRETETKAEDQLGKRPQDYFPPALADTLIGHYRACATTRKPLSYELESILPCGYACWRTMLVPIVEPQSDAVIAIVGICCDATAEKLAERAQKAFHENLHLAMGAIDGGFWTFECGTDRFEASRPLTNLLAGPDHPPLVDLAEYINFIYADDLAHFPDLTGDSSVEFRVMTYDGRTRWMHSKRRAIRDANGEVVRLVALVLDVTDDKMRQRKLEDQAATDELTGLRNRRAFEATAASLLGYPREAGNPVALILVDLDKFKPVNDAYGHKAGDELLKEVARRIARVVRPKDSVARIGGDEFALLVRANALPRVLARLERAFAQPYHRQNVSILVGASIGSAIQEAGDRCLADLMERADQALYAVKKQRRLRSA